jgi:hypothetical protein
LIESFPEKFNQDNLNILAECVPDLLDEVRYELECIPNTK